MLVALISEQTCRKSDTGTYICGLKMLTFGLEQTIVPTLGSYLPEVTPLKLVKRISSMTRLLYME
jgi:hypothetical protein